jgi:hypothetical protein
MAPDDLRPNSEPDPKERAPSEPSRRLTIDDVPRLGSGAGIAIGCATAVVLALALFWLVRGWLLRSP